MSNSISCRMPVLGDLTGSARDAASSTCGIRPQLDEHALHGSSGKPGQQPFALTQRTSTLSSTPALKPAFASICSARADSPVDCSEAGQRLCTDRRPERDRDHHERHPHRNSGLPVRRAPTRCARGKVVSLHEPAPLQGTRRQSSYPTIAPHCPVAIAVAMGWGTHFRAGATAAPLKRWMRAT